jgi:hypothetical protein
MIHVYQRLLESKKRKNLKEKLSKLFNINSRHSDDTIFLTKTTISSCKEKRQNSKKVILGSRKLFEQLKKNHLIGKRRSQSKAEWKENRQGSLYSKGDKSKQENLNLRFEWINNKLHLRNRQYIYAKVIRDVKREKGKRIEFMFILENVYRTENWFPYSVRLKTKNGNIYAFISIKEKLPLITIKRGNGIIGIDVNIYPFHLALAFTSKDVNLEKHQNTSLNELLEANSEKRQCLEDAVPKIHTVILQLVKNLMFFLLMSKNQKRDPSDFVFRMTRKGKFTKILEHSHQQKQQMRSLPTSRHKSWQV